MSSAYDFRFVCFFNFILIFFFGLAQVRELEAMLEEEKTQRAQALTVKKQLETELQEAEAQVEAANRGREEAVRQMKRLQVCEIKTGLVRVLEIRENYSFFSVVISRFEKCLDLG